MMPSMTMSHQLRGLAVAATGLPYVAVSNPGDKVEAVSAVCSDEKGAPLKSSFSIEAKATIFLIGCSQSTVLDTSLRQEESLQGTPNARAYAYELTSETPGGELQAFGLAPHAQAGTVDWTAINFFDPDEARSPTTVFAGIPVGNTPELWGTYTPRLALHNFAKVSQNASINLASTSEGSVRQMPVKTISLQPGQSASLDLSDISGDSTLLNTLTVTGTEESGGLAAQLLLEDSSQDIRFQIIGKSTADGRNIGMHPWELSDSKDSVLLLYNETGQPRSAAVRIGNGISVWEKSVDLAPFITKRLSLRKMLTEHWADDKGIRLTRGEGQGSFSWSAPRHGQLTGRLLRIDDQTRTVESFQCAGYQVICNGSISGPTSISVGQSNRWNGYTQGCINNQSPTLCNGVVSGGMGPESYSWSTSLSATTSSTSPYLSATAPSPGNYGISVTMNGAACSVYASTAVQATAPIPTGFTASAGTALANGALQFTYSFQSSTGNLADLSACKVGESVFYPGSSSPYIWPLPMAQSTTNPTVILGPATYGKFQDTNSPPSSFTKPYSNDSFTATQVLEWECSNYNNGAIQTFVPNISITRSVSLINNVWTYTISKSSYSNTVTLP